MTTGTEGVVNFSSDIGNVSYRCPTIHQWFDVTGDPSIALHTEGLCIEADYGYGYGYGYGYEQMFIVARALAATAEDVMTDDAFCAAIREEFERTAEAVRKAREA